MENLESILGADIKGRFASYLNPELNGVHDGLVEHLKDKVEKTHGPEELASVLAFAFADVCESEGITPDEFVKVWVNALQQVLRS